MARFDSLATGEVRIPSLKSWGDAHGWDDLDLVPAYRIDGASEHEDPTWRADWFAWRERVLVVRNEVQDRFARDIAFREEEFERCRTDPGWFITIWLWVEEPRPDDENLTEDGEFDTLKEFIPFAPQGRLVYLTVAILFHPTRYDLFISKARGFGVSYIMAAICFWAWTFKRGFRTRYLSQKLEKADRAHDLDSLFAKIDLFMQYLPDRFIPEGFNRGTKGRAVKHRQSAMFKNPQGGAQITAEATTGDSVRGGRGASVFNDEAAFQEQYKATRATVGGSTRHRIDWSSESFAKGRQWWDAWHTAQKVNKERREKGLDPVATVIEIDWYENPYQDQRWYETEQAAYESDGNLEEFATEYLRDPRQHGTHVYPQVGDCPDTPEWFDKTRMLNAGIDPGMADDCAFVFWQNHFPEGKKKVRWLDSFVRNRLPAEWYAHVMTGIMPIPGDVAYPYAEDLEHSEIQRMMLWLGDIPAHMLTIYGDPAIQSQDTGASSFRRRFILTSQELSDRRIQGDPEKGIAPDATALDVSREIVQPYRSIYLRNNHPDRRMALRKALAYSEFSLTDGAQLLKEDIGNVRFGEVTERTSLAPKVRHDRHTHRTSGAEFGMVFDDLLIHDDDVWDGEKVKQEVKKHAPERLKGRTPGHRDRRSRSSRHFDPVKAA